MKGKTCTQNDINSPVSLLAWPSSEGIGVDIVENIAAARGFKSKLRGDSQRRFAVILKGLSICKSCQGEHIEGAKSRIKVYETSLLIRCSAAKWVLFVLC